MTEPRGWSQACNPTPGFLKNAAAQATNTASLVPRSKMNPIIAIWITYDYDKFVVADRPEVTDRPSAPMYILDKCNVMRSTAVMPCVSTRSRRPCALSGGAWW